MAANPRVLLMDEPFGALDAIIRARLQDDLLSMYRWNRTTILFVTHDLDEAFRLGDRVAIMNEGHLVQYDTPAALIASPASEYVERLLGFLDLRNQLALAYADDASKWEGRLKIDNDIETVFRNAQIKCKVWQKS